MKDNFIFQIAFFLIIPSTTADEWLYQYYLLWWSCRHGYRCIPELLASCI